MARPGNLQAHIASAIEDLLRSVTRLVDSVESAIPTGQKGPGTERGSAGSETRAKPSPGRLRQIAAMKAYWKKRKAEEGKTGRKD